MKRTLQILALALLTMVGGIVGGYVVNSYGALSTAERSKLRNGLGDRTFANRVADLLDELDAGTLSTEHITSTDDGTITDSLSVGDLQTTENVGTAGTNVTAVEYGDSFHHVTHLTLASVAYTIGDIGNDSIDGGVGLIVTGNVMVDHRALGEPGNVVVEDFRDIELLTRWAERPAGRQARPRSGTEALRRPIVRRHG